MLPFRDENFEAGDTNVAEDSIALFWKDNITFTVVAVCREKP